MPRDSWTRRLDDRLLGATGLAITFAFVALGFASAAVAMFIGTSWPSAVIDTALAVVAAQAARTQWRRRVANK